jgi:hypothetical protein
MSALLSITPVVWSNVTKGKWTLNLTCLKQTLLLEVSLTDMATFTDVM